MSARRTLIIVPVLDDLPSLTILLQELARALADRPAVSMLIVDDGSLPAVDIGDLAGPGLVSGQVVMLSRNFGHQRAIAIGLAYAVAHDLADVIVIMDADGEDSPGDVPRLLAALDSMTEMSIAVARRTKRSERPVFKAFYQLYRMLFLILTGERISFGNFCALPMGAAKRLVAMSELWVSLPATLLRSRLPLVELPTERSKRYLGNPRMNVQSLVTHGFGAVSAFLETVLTRMIMAAAGLAALFVLASVVAAILKVAGMATPGWMTTVVGISLILVISVAILSFIGLALRILAGAHTVPAPSALYNSFIARVAKFGPATADAVRQHPIADRGAR